MPINMILDCNEMRMLVEERVGGGSLQLTQEVSWTTHEAWKRNVLLLFFFHTGYTYGVRF